MNLSEAEKRMIYQVEGTSQGAALNEIYMTWRYAPDKAMKDTAESLLKKLRPLSDKECMDVIREVQQNYRLPGKAMSVSSRLKQYGVFRAIGLSTGQLRKMIVAEAFTYTIIGGIVGTVLGLFSNKVLFKMLISYKWGDTWTIPLTELGIILLIVVLSALLAVYGPIKRIHHTSIVDTISTQ